MNPEHRILVIWTAGTICVGYAVAALVYGFTSHALWAVVGTVACMIAIGWRREEEDEEWTHVAFTREPQHESPFDDGLDIEEYCWLVPVRSGEKEGLIPVWACTELAARMEALKVVHHMAWPDPLEVGTPSKDGPDA